ACQVRTYRGEFSVHELQDHRQPVLVPHGPVLRFCAMKRLLVLLVVLVGCAREVHRLPTGAVLDPAGSSVWLGSMAVAMVCSPASSRIVCVLSGFKHQGIQVVDRASHKLVQTLEQPAAFLGAAFTPNGDKLFVSGGNGDLVYEYAWRADTAAVVDSIAL